jgi:hypothetical protein
VEAKCKYPIDCATNGNHYTDCPMSKEYEPPIDSDDYVRKIYDEVNKLSLADIKAHLVFQKRSKIIGHESAVWLYAACLVLADRLSEELSSNKYGESIVV